MAQMTKPTDSGRTFEPCPEGAQRAVCVDFIDCGWEEVSFEGQSKGMQPKVKLVFATENLREDGKPFLLFDRKMKWSFHEKAALTKRLMAWLGKKRFDELLESGADTDSLIGINAIISVEHNEYNGSMYANVGSIAPLMKGMEPLGIGDYERMQNRDDYVPPVPSAFDDPQKAGAILRGLKESAENANAAADAAYKPTPAYPHSEYSAPDAAATVASPMSAEQTGKLMQQGALIFGTASITEIEALAQKFFGKSWPQMSSDECSRLMHELRSVKPAAAVSARMAGTPTEVEMSEPFSPFADEGEPGFRPEGHPDRENDGNGQGELVTTAAGYPAN